jgi:hypothetical protein
MKYKHIIITTVFLWVFFSTYSQTPSKWEIPEKYDSLIVFLSDTFEDLHNIKIIVKEKTIGTTMAMRPTLFSMLKKPQNRTYVLCINNRDEFSGVLLKDVPREARVGIMAHELMHVRDYKSRNFLGLAERGWQYLSKRGKHKFEHEIDQMVIDSGFGFFLYYWKAHLMDESDIDNNYRKFKKRVYMGPQHVLTELQKRGEIEAL